MNRPIMDAAAMAKFKERVRQIYEENEVDPHDTCQECHFNYPHVMQRTLKPQLDMSVCMPLSIAASSSSHTPSSSSHSPSSSAEFVEATRVESQWKNALLFNRIPIDDEKVLAGVRPPLIAHPFPSLQYLAKLAIWEMYTKNEEVIQNLPANEELKNDLTDFCKQENIAADKHVRRKFKQLLFCPVFIDSLA